MEPILLQGVCKDYIWGGNRLRKEYGKISNDDIIAESWELACHKDGSSIIISGENKGLDLKEYIQKYGIDFLGSNCRNCNSIPVLVKLIDARDNLSIQVHPNDEYSRRIEGESGKTEMWYIIDAEPGSTLYYGVKNKVSKEEFARRIDDQTLTEIMNKVEVKPGELYFIPSGTLHAIGSGILLVEIQQNSNTTYRVYDYGRKGNDGKLRELHVEKALEVANLQPMSLSEQYSDVKIDGGSVRKLEHCEYFSSDLVIVDKRVSFFVDDTSFRHIEVLNGSGSLITDKNEILITKGSSILLPAGIGHYEIYGNCEFILTYIENELL